MADTPMRVDTLVFTTDACDWMIYTTTNKYTNVGRGQHGQRHTSQVYSYHAECEEITSEEHDPVNCWHKFDRHQHCILCNDPVPEEIQTLIYLYMMR